MKEENMNIYKKIVTARIMFLQNTPKKSGYNKFKNFDYFELKDIVPIGTKLCKELGLYTHVSIDSGKAVMSVINIANPDECVHFKLDVPVMEADKYNLEHKNVYQTMLQNTGAAETYLRRYLYFLFLDITDNDSVDAPDFNTKEPNDSIPKSESVSKSFKTADEAIEEKSAARVIADTIIRGLKEPDLLSAKKTLSQMLRNKELTLKESKEVIHELEVLLNGTGSKSNS